MKSRNDLASLIQHRCPSLTVSRVLAVTIMLGLAMLAIPAAQAQFSVIHDFSAGGDGAAPYSGLTTDASGNLYGTTSAGGFGGSGTVYKMHFKTGTWLLGTLYTFTGGEDGGTPTAGVIRDSNGVLYGTTFGGGAYGAGAVFELAPPAKASTSVVAPWTEKSLYSFTGGGDGGFPDMLGGSLAFDAAGNLYGTTLYGGNSSCNSPLGACGVVFKLTNSKGNWTVSVLHAFAGGFSNNYPPSDGANPYGGVVLDAQGNVYGATTSGGYGIGCAYGCGIIYQMTPSGSGWTENILMGFCNPYSCLDGINPTGIAIDNSGNLYTASDSAAVEMKKNGAFFEDVLNPYVGSYPTGNLIMDSAGNLYGTSVFGGAYGYGSVFELTPSSPYWTYTSLHDFTGGSDGGEPYGALLLDSKGNLYGTASMGGSGGSCSGGCGVVFEIK